MLWNRKSQAPRCAGESTQVFLYEPLSQQEHRGAVALISNHKNSSLAKIELKEESTQQHTVRTELWEIRKAANINLTKRPRTNKATI